MNESKLQRKIHKAIEQEFNSWLFKTHGGPFQKAGIPDLICCIDGFFVAIEVKLPGKIHTLTPLQQEVIKDIRKAGGIAFVATSPGEAIQGIKEQLEKR